MYVNEGQKVREIDVAPTARYEEMLSKVQQNQLKSWSEKNQ